LSKLPIERFLAQSALPNIQLLAISIAGFSFLWLSNGQEGLPSNLVTFWV
jgi:hypothetical protein